MLDQIKMETWTANTNAGTTERPRAQTPWTSGCPSLTAPLYAIEGETHMRLWFALPAIQPDSLTLTATGATVTVRGTPVAPEIGEGEEMILGTQPPGQGWWTLRLPFEVSEGSAEATLRHGLLELKVIKKMRPGAGVAIPLKAA